MRRVFRLGMLWSMAGMLVATVLVSAGAVEQSYVLAQLQRQDDALTKRQQVLHEQLAVAQSLQRVQQYAQERGFVRRVPGSLSLTLPAATTALAQQP